MVSPFERSLQRHLRRSFRCQRSMRVWTLLLGLCYLILSVFLPSQHTHIGNEEADTGYSVLTISEANLQPHRMAQSDSALNSDLHKSVQKPASKNRAAHKLVIVKAGKTHPGHCMACEWQAMQVSAALPAFKLFLTETTPPRVVTTLPRCLRSRAIATASRGPPTV